jgi:hypothetical protein
MIIDNLDIPRIVISPHETNPPLIIHANAMLSGAPSGQRLQVVAANRRQIQETFGSIEHHQTPVSRLLDIAKPAAALETQDSLRFFAPEASDQFILMILRKRY